MIVVIHLADVGRWHIAVGRKDEHVLVADFTVFEHSAVNRVEKRLGDLEIVVALDQPGKGLARLAPEIQVVQVLAGDQFDVLIHTACMNLVEVYAPGRSLLNTMPVGVFKP